MLAGAAFDLVENALLLANIRAGRDLSDGRVDLMRAAGVAKYATIVAGAILYLVAWTVERRRRRR